jgi:ubiquinone biosynthesis protein COQ9
MFFADVQLEFQRFIELSLTKDDISVILEDLKNNPVTINEFREKINLIIESFLKYGKNIYPWK